MRIYAIPDQDGLIRVACGSDMLEILVVTPSGGSGGRRGSGSSGSDETYMALTVPGRPLTVLDMPYTASIAGKGRKNSLRLDLDSIVDTVRSDIEAPDRPSPAALVLSESGAIDIHQVTELTSRMGGEAPGVGIAVKFQID